jgi:hypothetical protein
MNTLNLTRQQLRDIILSGASDAFEKEPALDELLRRAASDEIEVGDLVAPKVGHILRSGGMVYTAAVVVSVSPFVMVSGDGDMLWRTLSSENFETLGTALPYDQIRALRRWKEEKLKTNED